MLCDDSHLILGQSNLFERVGIPNCAISWIEVAMIACTVGMVILVFYHVANHCSRWVEWFYLKMRTRQQSSD
jgi:hypothetical protein